MANITHGMNIADVRTLATQMDNAANEIQNLSKQIASKLHGAGWSGPDRNRFESDWSGQHTQQLNTVINALKQAAVVARKNASDQENVSNA